MAVRIVVGRWKDDKGIDTRGATHGRALAEGSEADVDGPFDLCKGIEWKVKCERVGLKGDGLVTDGIHEAFRSKRLQGHKSHLFRRLPKKLARMTRYVNGWSDAYPRQLSCTLSRFNGACKA